VLSGCRDEEHFVHWEFDHCGELGGRYDHSRLPNARSAIRIEEQKALRIGKVVDMITVGFPVHEVLQ